MQSLKDKLLKAGLVTEEAAKKVETEAKAPREPRPESHRRESRPAGPPRERREAPVAEVRVPRFAPLPGSAAAHREMARKQNELNKKLREKVLASQVLIEDGATPFYFATRKGKLRRLLITEPQAVRIRDGELAIVERPDPDKIDYALVPAAVAKEMHALSDKAVRFLKAEGAESLGFLSDDEIHRRASEADAPEVHEPAAPEAPAPAEESAAPADATWITIKRAPVE